MLVTKVFKKISSWIYKTIGMDTRKQFIYVLGNSHTRAFSYNKNFFPLFVGAGKTHCLISEESLSLLKSSFGKALANIKNSKVMLVLGEPDTRYYLGMGWYPWEGIKQFDILDFKPHIDESFVRYVELLAFLKRSYINQYIVFNITPVENENQNVIINYFNSLLRTFCEKEGLLFVDINDQLYLSGNTLSPKFLGDQIHLNNQIQPFVEQYLIQRGVITTSYFKESVNWDHHRVKDIYKYSEKFGCYVLK